jgi:crotonobetainyl-CoA:carnitine CoA-transferase CaiB-like acyl-CoA transferase
MNEDSVLGGIKVLDLGSDISAPYTARLLADNGAEVIKVEPPGGEIARRKGSFLDNKPNSETSSLFIALNTSKRGITLDITSAKGRELLLKMVDVVDAVIENFDPDYLASLNLGYDELSKINPKLVQTSITNFGQEGPYRHWDTSEGAIQAFSGLMIISGEPDRSPLKTGLPLAQYTAGLTGFATTLAAIYYAQLTGEGQHVDIALCDAIAANIDQLSLAWAFDYPDKEMRSRYGLRRGPLEGLYQCSDGFVGCTTTDFSEVKRLATIISPDQSWKGHKRLALPIVMLPTLKTS